jgi:hypothetical protein
MAALRALFEGSIFPQQQPVMTAGSECIYFSMLLGLAVTDCRYKFCVAMENSIQLDYISEKVWDALTAGCVPIYMGSSRARYTVPDPNSIIV